MKEADIPEKNGIFHELYEECNISKLSDMEKQDYEKSVLEYEDVKEAMKYHRKMGITEGFEKGLEKGEKKGREEALLQTARNFLKLGISIADIAKATGLSEEQIAKLQS